MPEIGLFLSSEEHGPRALVDQARMAEEAGFRAVLISDHFHPWLESQARARALSFGAWSAGSPRLRG